MDGEQRGWHRRPKILLTLAVAVTALIALERLMPYLGTSGAVLLVVGAGLAAVERRQREAPWRGIAKLLLEFSIAMTILFLGFWAFATLLFVSTGGSGS